MPDEERTFSPDTTHANRTQMQGGGVGQREMDLQQQPNAGKSATAPSRTEPFDTDKQVGGGANLQSREGGEGPGGSDQPRRAGDEGAFPGGEDLSAELGQDGSRVARGDEGLPSGADQYDFDGADNPQEDGGDPSGGMHQGASHTRWGVKTEAERGQGPKTRARNKDINSGRT